MKLNLDLQLASIATALPDQSSFERWVKAALPSSQNLVELSIRLVDEDEGRQLNSDYRGRDYPTNILSFPFELPAGVDDAEALALLGDLVICAPVVAREASEQGKSLSDHWAHLVVHGTLHLLGYDHTQQDEAEAMEALEVSILQGLGISDPYLITATS